MTLPELMDGATKSKEFQNRLRVMDIDQVGPNFAAETTRNQGPYIFLKGMCASDLGIAEGLAVYFGDLLDEVFFHIMAG